MSGQNAFDTNPGTTRIAFNSARGKYLEIQYYLQGIKMVLIILFKIFTYKITTYKLKITKAKKSVELRKALFLAHVNQIVLSNPCIHFKRDKSPKICVNSNEVFRYLDQECSTRSSQIMIIMFQDSHDYF